MLKNLCYNVVKRAKRHTFVKREHTASNPERLPILQKRIPSVRNSRSATTVNLRLT